MSSSTAPAEPVKQSILTNEQYNVLKWIALVFLPALAALYLGLAALWDLPKPTEVAGTVTLLDTFLGLLLNVATKNYNNSDTKFDGALHVDNQDTRLIHQLEITTPPEDLGKKDAIVLKVVPTTSSE
jgi:hypothetical protein